MPNIRNAFKVLWSIAAAFDAATEHVFQGLQASWPGLGTPTALPFVGRARGMIRGESETDSEYAARLLTWIEKARALGSAERIATAIHEFCANHPRVRIVTRSGRWVTLETNGTITRTTAAWDWDSVSNPERAGFWSEIWIIVYPTQWSPQPVLGLPTSPALGTVQQGLGHQAPPSSVDAIRGLVQQCKSAHTKVRALIWTSDAALFDPAVPVSLPNGNWGSWGVGSPSRIPSDRNTTTCRYWEFD